MGRSDPTTTNRPARARTAPQTATQQTKPANHSIPHQAITLSRRMTSTKKRNPSGSRSATTSTPNRSEDTPASDQRQTARFAALISLTKAATKASKTWSKAPTSSSLYPHHRTSSRKTSGIPISHSSRPSHKSLSRGRRVPPPNAARSMTIETTSPPSEKIWMRIPKDCLAKPAPLSTSRSWRTSTTRNSWTTLKGLPKG